VPVETAPARAPMKTTRMFEETLEAWVAGKRRCTHEGGTSSSKTWSILQALIMIAQKWPEPILISIVSESLPHLKRGAMRDFFNILEEDEHHCPHFNRTENVYSRADWKGRFEFFGADDAAKARGPRRHILFINEGNNVPWETARGLDIRTEMFTVVDWNPVSEFWAHEYETEVGQKVTGWRYAPDTHHVHSTYLDAKEVLPQSVVDNIESNRETDPNWWNVYGLGNPGKVTGLVYPYFEQVDVLPAGDRFFGLDFGYTNDPSALVANVIIGDALYSRELFYRTGMTNDVISREMRLCHLKKNFDEITADSAEPKSIAEISEDGWNIDPCVKGQGSVKFGIQLVNQYRQFWTKDSLNCIKAQRNCSWIRDKLTGKLTDKITKKWLHGMDARRYAVGSYEDDYGGGSQTDSESDW